VPPGDRTHIDVAIQQAHGPIDVLVNNAGIEPSGSVEELPLSDFRAVMETNYFGVIRCISRSPRK
jgi:NAD(P)-dependent dehydrogenase (short-subunit alcohol dehydrogenase family)